MPKKKNVKKILIIVVILFALILGVRELALNAIERAKLENKTYTSISDFTSVKEIAKYMGCTYIKEEPSTGEKYDIDIYLKFKYPLYTDEVSNEDYYYKMIALMLEYLNYQNIRLIDQENDIVIAVECDKEKKEIGACILGVLEGLAGLVLLFSGIQRFITDVMAAYMVGAVILIYGIFQIVGGIKTYSTSKGKGILSIICGVLSVIVSIVSFTHPVLTMISAGYMIAFSVLMQGINMIVLAVNFEKESE